MDLAVILPIIVLAAIDSINPVEILAGIFLFTFKKPAKSFFSYTLGIFIFHFAVGLAFYWGIDFLLHLAVLKSPFLDRAVELVCGILLVFFGLSMKKRNKVSEKTILNPRPAYTFLLGIGITITALPTSAAYYAALGIMARNRLAWEGTALLLILYNLIFIAPLFVLLGVYLAGRQKSAKIFERIREYISVRINRLMRVILVLAGLYLIANFLANVSA